MRIRHKGFEFFMEKTLPVMVKNKSIHGKIRYSNALGYNYFGKKYMFGFMIPWFNLWSDSSMSRKSTYHKIVNKLCFK